MLTWGDNLTLNSQQEIHIATNGSLTEHAVSRAVSHRMSHEVQNTLCHEGVRHTLSHKGIRHRLSHEWVRTLNVAM